MKPVIPSRIVLPLLFTLFELLGMYSCKKGSKAAVYNFSYTGNLLINDTIFFNSTASGASTFLWNFGDGSSSAVATPAHVYTTSGSFVVTLTVGNNSIGAISKTLSIKSSLYDFTYTGALWVYNT